MSTQPAPLARSARPGAIRPAITGAEPPRALSRKFHNCQSARMRRQRGCSARAAMGFLDARADQGASRVSVAAAAAAAWVRGGPDCEARFKCCPPSRLTCVVQLALQGALCDAHEVYPFSAGGDMHSRPEGAWLRLHAMESTRSHIVFAKSAVSNKRRHVCGTWCKHRTSSFSRSLFKLWCHCLQTG